MVTRREASGVASPRSDGVVSPTRAVNRRAVRGTDVRGAEARSHSGAPEAPMRTVLCGLAEFERELIRARTGEGRKRAMARGVRFGRKPKLTRHQRREALARREAGEPLADIGRSYNLSHSTISRLRGEDARCD